MDLTSLTGFSLLYVAVVLFINGLWLLDKIDSKEIAFINSFVGIITFLVAFNFVFSSNASADSIKAGAFTFLFSCTYCWIAFNQYTNSDGHSLGWYCLFVSITAVPITVSAFNASHSVQTAWLAACWAMWVLLWFSYFLHLVYAKIAKHILGWLTIIISVLSAWLPGYLLIGRYI